DAEERLQLRAETGFHRALNGYTDSHADAGEEHNRDDRPDPELPFEEQAGVGDRATDGGGAEGDVGLSRRLAARKSEQSGEPVEHREIRDGRARLCIYRNYGELFGLFGGGREEIGSATRSASDR